MAAAVQTALPAHAGPSTLALRRFQGDGEGMVDLLVDACVRAKELQRHSALSEGSSPPRAGRELVSYFNPGSSDWGVEDINVNTDDSDVTSDGTDSLRGSVNGEDSQTSLGKKTKKTKKRGKQATKIGGVVPAVPVALAAGAVPVRFAGTTFGLAAPLPETLPMPSSLFLRSLGSSAMLQPDMSRNATAHLKALLAGPHPVAAV